jgi:uncharacterized protein (DUF697 family)
MRRWFKNEGDAVPAWGDLGNMLNTLREVDINAIRAESERHLAIACIGRPEALDTLERLLYHAGSRRYGPIGANPLYRLDLPLESSDADLRSFDLLICAVDGRDALSEDELAAIDRVERLNLPLLVIGLYVGQTSDDGRALPPRVAAHAVSLTDPTTASAPDTLANAVIGRLPADLLLSAARKLPGIRPALAVHLLKSTSFANASYSAASALPQQIPILALPFVAADILILTKNQAIMVYKLALAHGAPPEFQARMIEITPVIGGAFIWRQVARSLVSLIPVWGVVPKVAIAYAGTYTTGFAAWQWYANGDKLSAQNLAEVSQKALSQGREIADRLVAQIKERQGKIAAANAKKTPSWWERLRPRLPTRRSPEPPALPAPPDETITPE